MLVPERRAARQPSQRACQRTLWATGSLCSHREVGLLSAQAPDDLARRGRDRVDGGRSAHRDKEIPCLVLCERIDMAADHLRFVSFR